MGVSDKTASVKAFVPMNSIFSFGALALTYRAKLTMCSVSSPPGARAVIKLRATDMRSSGLRHAWRISETHPSQIVYHSCRSFLQRSAVFQERTGSDV